MISDTIVGTKYLCSLVWLWGVQNILGSEDNIS